MYRRAASGRFYAQDNVTGKQESLKTSDRTEALRLLDAKNEAEYQPAFNAQLARTYLAAGDSAIGQRTWQLVMDTLLRTKEGRSANCRARYERAIKQKSFNTLRALPLLQTRTRTRPEHLLGAIEPATVPASSVATTPSPTAGVHDEEVGGARGRAAMAALKNAIGRVEASWRPANAEESFEIVRRRLFQHITDPTLFTARDTVAKAFCDLYRTHHQEFPPESQQNRRNLTGNF